MKDKFDKGMNRITMPEDKTVERPSEFPEPVSRDFAFDDAFFEQDITEEGEWSPSVSGYEFAVNEESGSYDFGAFGGSQTSSDYHPGEASFPADDSSLRQSSGSKSDPYSDLFTSINKELSQIETEETARETAERGAITAPQSEAPAKGQNTLSYDEIRARFKKKEKPKTPRQDGSQTQAVSSFALHSDLELDDGDDWLNEMLAPSAQEVPTAPAQEEPTAPAQEEPITPAWGAISLPDEEPNEEADWIRENLMPLVQEEAQQPAWEDAAASDEANGETARTEEPQRPVWEDVTLSDDESDETEWTETYPVSSAQRPIQSAWTAITLSDDDLNDGTDWTEAYAISPATKEPAPSTGEPDDDTDQMESYETPSSPEEPIRSIWNDLIQSDEDLNDGTGWAEAYPISSEPEETREPEETISSTWAGLTLSELDLDNEEDWLEDNPLSLSRKEPAFTTQEEPAFTTPDEPAFTTQEEPTFTTQDEPAFTAQEEPAFTTPDEPAFTTQEEPTFTTQDEPAFTTQDEPAFTAPDEPAFTTPDEPAFTVPDEQAFAIQDDLTFAIQDEPAFAILDEPEEPIPPEPDEPAPPLPKRRSRPLASAASMNIRLDTENERDDDDLFRHPYLAPVEEIEDDALTLREAAKGQLAEYFPEGEEPPVLGPYTAPEGNFFSRNIIPAKGDKPPELIRKVIMLIALLAVIGSAGYLFNDYVIMPIRTENKIEKLSELIDEDNKGVIEPNEKKNEYPGVDFPVGMMEKYAALYARNPDFVGWLSIDAFDISLPVVQAADNDKYLKTDFDGKKSKYGSLFVNATNNMETLDMNTTIFGHNMKDMSMLSRVINYTSASGYKQAPVIQFNTLYGDYKWKVFAVFITNGEESGDGGYMFNYMFANLSNEAVMESYLGEIKQRALYYPEVDIALDDKILTLSTCTYEFDNARLVVLARMVRPGESSAVTGKAFINENPRYPQAYYDKRKLNNPYAGATKWYPS